MTSQHAAAADGRLPLSALLSHLLVAFTIEFDNEFEPQTPHRTTSRGSTSVTARSLAGVAGDVVELHAICRRVRADRG